MFYPVSVQYSATQKPEVAKIDCDNLSSLLSIISRLGFAWVAVFGLMLQDFVRLKQHKSAGYLFFIPEMQSPLSVIKKILFFQARDLSNIACEYLNIIKIISKNVHYIF